MRQLGSNLAAQLLLAACAHSAAQAANTTLTVTAAQDTSIYFGTADSATRADGSGDFLWLSVTAEGLGRRALLKFDLSAIPPGATVREVTLTLFESMSRENHDVAVHRLLASWGEGASNAGGSGTGAPAAPGDATWSHRFYPTTLWTTPGGDLDPVPSVVRFVDLPNAFYSWTGVLPTNGGLVPRVVQDVQSWVGSPQSNHGWILIGKETGSQNAKRFQSRNNAVVQTQPRLTVVYSLPEPVADDGDIPIPLWALGLLAALLIRVGMARTDHA